MNATHLDFTIIFYATNIKVWDPGNICNINANKKQMVYS